MRYWLSLVLLFLACWPSNGLASSLPQSPSYAETRRLLLEMRNDQQYRILKQLFEVGEARLSDYIQLLDDADDQVSFHAQLVIRYLAEPRGLAAIRAWCLARIRQGKKCIYPAPVSEEESEPKYLGGDERDLAQLVLKNWNFVSEAARRSSSAKVLALGPKRDRALIEVTVACDEVCAQCIPLCGQGWHVTIKKVGQYWRQMVARFVWES